jgi:hypothetical protein
VTDACDADSDGYALTVDVVGVTDGTIPDAVFAHFEGVENCRRQGTLRSASAMGAANSVHAPVIWEVGYSPNRALI